MVQIKHCLEIIFSYLLIFFVPFVVGDCMFSKSECQRVFCLCAYVSLAELSRELVSCKQGLVIPFSQIPFPSSLRFPILFSNLHPSLFLTLHPFFFFVFFPLSPPSSLHRFHSRLPVACTSLILTASLSLIKSHICTQLLSYACHVFFPFAYRKCPNALDDGHYHLEEGLFKKPVAAILFHRLFHVHIAVPVRKAVAKIKVGMVI